MGVRFGSASGCQQGLSEHDALMLLQIKVFLNFCYGTYRNRLFSGEFCSLIEEGELSNCRISQLSLYRHAVPGVSKGGRC